MLRMLSSSILLCTFTVAKYQSITFMKSKYLITLFFLGCFSCLRASDVVWYNGSGHVTYQVVGKCAPVVDIALDMFSNDMKAVTGKKAMSHHNGTIQVFQLDQLDNKSFKILEKTGLPFHKIITREDAFYIGVYQGKIGIIGSNGRGTAYGILELSRMAGVSPWIWWGDIRPAHKNRLAISQGFVSMQWPSVKYRGMFLNDEDWSTRCWSHTMMDKHLREGAIGPRTYKKIFELLLRLRANTIWPAMHPGTTPFFSVKGNLQVADSCGMYIGTSHCEPLLRNNVGEWDVKQRGPFNYLTNKKNIQEYWAERLKETQGIDAIYTLGMRGIHDDSMEGVHTLQQKTDALQQVINDQRKLLHTYVNKNLKEVPQIFVPYKEVLQIYENGLKVPDDVMLMWCDDNYGYLTRLSDQEQQKRQGGSGVYYHLSYWGRPHDYLWLATTQPGLIYHEMKTAYDHQARKMWIVNVHDPKVAAYGLSLFLDMAWNINSVSANTVQEHLRNWLCQQFGTTTGQKLLPIMTEYYRLTGIRKPEFMGWSQVEVDEKKGQDGITPVQDTEFNPDAFGNELEEYLADYEGLKEKVDEAEKTVRPALKDAFYAAIKYPVYMAADMAMKELEAQEARHIARPQSFHHDKEALASAAKSVKAFREIQAMTDYYNHQMSGGKWKDLMSFAPRDLPVFRYPTLPDKLSEEEIQKYGNENIFDDEIQHPKDDCIVGNACNYQAASAGAKAIDMLGHSMKAIALPKNDSLTYRFHVDQEGTAMLRTALIPTQPYDSGDIRVAVSIDGQKPVIFSLKEPFRSEQWKQNVLRGQAVKNTMVNLTRGDHQLTIKALDDHIIIDQWMVDFNPDRQFYMFPIQSAL